MNYRHFQALLLPPLWALLIALLCASLLILISGGAPLPVYRLLIEGTWGNLYGVGQVLFKTTPLIMTGLSVAIGLRAGLFNIGAEGQITMGAFSCALVGGYLPAGTPWPLALIACMTAAFVGGALTALGPATLRVTSGAHEVITTIMLNFVVRAAMIGAGAYLFQRESLHTRPIVAGAELSRLSRWFAGFSGSAVSTSILFAIAAAAATWWFLFRTKRGFQLRATGLQRPAADNAGIPTQKVVLSALLLSGGLSGLGGINFVLGYKHYYEDGFAGGVGYMGIAVAVLGRNHPLGVILAALLFGTLSQGGLAVNALVPKELIDVLQATIILAIAASVPELRRLLKMSVEP